MKIYNYGLPIVQTSDQQKYLLVLEGSIIAFLRKSNDIFDSEPAIYIRCINRNGNCYPRIFAEFTPGFIKVFENNI